MPGFHFGDCGLIKLYGSVSISSSSSSPPSTRRFHSSCSGSMAWNSGITSVANSSSASQMCSWRLRPAWLSRITWSTLDSAKRCSLARIVAGEPISPPCCAFCPAGAAFHVWYSSHRLTVPGTTGPCVVVEAQGELEERRAVGPRLRLLVGRRRT